MNDRFGHAAGDVLLRKFALFLKDCIYRNDDIVARLGGDEFAMLLDRVTCVEEAAVLASRIVANMPRRCGLEGSDATIGISVGIIIAAARHQTPEALPSEAHQAFYHAKRTGKGRFSVFSALELVV